MPYEEMVFMKRTIFPFLIKVRPSLRDSAFSLRFPAENFRTAKFSAGKTLRKRRDGRKRDSEGENCDRRSACVRQGKRKRIVPEPLFMPYPGMKRGSGCGEGSPAPSALHVRVVLPISTSAGIASFPTADHPVTSLSSSSKSTPPYKLHESPGTLPVSNPISAPSATSRIAVLISYP